MKRFLAFAMSLAALAATAACHGEKDNGGRVVYVAGATVDAQGKYTATLWENGVPKQLSKNYSEASSVCVSGGDVYVVGYEQYGTDQIYRPVLWTNGSPQYLPTETDLAEAISVHVSGGNVYVAGLEEEDGYHRAKTWVNGLGRRLGTGIALSTFASSGNVYAAGWVIDASSERLVPMLWTNGEPQALATSDAVAASVFVSGGVVYVAGVEGTDFGGRAVLWTNGAAQRLGDQEDSEAHSVFVAGGNVYVAGFMTDSRGNGLPTVWKNGAAQRLESAHDAVAHSVYVSENGDVYAAGIETDGQYVARPRLWENGVAQSLGGGTPGSLANCVFVKEK